MQKRHKKRVRYLLRHKCIYSISLHTICNENVDLERMLEHLRTKVIQTVNLLTG